MSAPSTFAGTPEALKCQTCTTVVTMPISQARALGWRIWEGKTVSGDESSVRFCRDCIGVPGEEPAVEEVEDWTAECSTCDASMAEDWEGERPETGWTEKDAKDWRRSHECEPWVEISPPKKTAVAA